MTQFLADIEKYWAGRAAGYSEVNQEELKSGQRKKWLREIRQSGTQKRPEDTTVLDVGTGPGFFAIILAEAGYQVTAVDYTEEMLNEARKNAGSWRDKIVWMQMDAQDLGFADDTFDMIVTRNLTWNLKDPERAYREWYRVLKKGGILLNFDANWYAYLYDEELRKAYIADRKSAAEHQVQDYYEGTDIAEMERLAYEMPLSRIHRPDWDLRVMKEIGFEWVEVDETAGERVLSEAEKINYKSTPVFMVKGRK